MRNWRSVLRNIVDSRQKIEELKQIDILHEEKERNSRIPRDPF